MPGSSVELVGAAGVCVGILPALRYKQRSSSLHGYQNHVGALLSISITLKVLPEPVVKQIWASSVFVK